MKAADMRLPTKKQQIAVVCIQDAKDGKRRRDKELAIYIGCSTRYIVDCRYQLRRAGELPKRAPRS